MKAKVKNIKATLYVFSVYYPPNMKVDEVTKMNELLSDEILKIQVSEVNPLFVLAGDTNKKNLSCFDKNEAKMEKVKIGATRNDACLDACYANFGMRSEIRDPLSSEDGTFSDHKVILCEASFSRPKHVYTKVLKRKITK